MSKSTSFLALGCVSAAAFAVPATAQSGDQPRLGGVTVVDTAIDDEGVKVEKADSPKYVRPLLDTPQTITVIASETLQQQNLLTLREVLSTVPGITFAAGEGGFGYGDRITLRGYSANNDISVDGVRSGAVMNRNETFNIEQVEVTNGANSVYNGGGSVGGTINLVTKKPLNYDRTVINAGVGTDEYYRGTVDSNFVSGDIAVRLNAVYHQNEIPGRQVEFYERWGIAPSVTAGINGPTRLTLQFEHLDDKGMPQYGLRYFPMLGGFLPDFNQEAYYGFRNVDTQESITNSVQAIFEHDFSETLRFRNLTRYENIQQYTVTSQPAGTFCLSNNLQPLTSTTPGATAASCTVRIGNAQTGPQLVIPAGYFLPTGGRGNPRYIRNQTAYTQFDLSGEFNTGGLEHTFVLGFSSLWERFTQDGGSLLTAPTAPGYYPLVNIANPNEIIAGPGGTGGGDLVRVYGNNEYTGPVNFNHTSRNRGVQASYAAYLFDAIKFSDMFEINGGVRYEKYDGRNNVWSVAGGVFTPNANNGRTTSSDELFSWRVGAVFKPAENISTYVAFGNSRTPSKGSIDAACTNTLDANNNTCSVEPESAKNYEIGAKADLFSGGLQLAAALFRNERDKYRVASGEPGLNDQVLDGHSRVDGISLSASGNITPAWSIVANYTYLDSKLIRSVSEYCLQNPGKDNCTNTVEVPDPGAGTMLPATPDHSGSLFTSYSFPFGLQIGYGFTYQGSHALNPVPTATVPTTFNVPDYLTHRLMVGYKLNDNLNAQLNIQNLTDEDYVTTVRTAVGGSWAQPGVGRSAVLSIGYTF
ncbi:TonB-dependent receptor [Altererythrobacter xixiisoli]|uniref:TonB-dependent receptor n=1 Tax=Croceibacterium xixiisoli TaxID=1476466 RepID=A0A6I4TZJ0_9SPHN|nr:TonB-dependent receptor [Croceibacterium xixiisoli]MXO99773.1 TonB-dependent receptor [Croceibacterium xixiisoli]